MKIKIIYLLLMLSFVVKAQESPNVFFIIVDQHSGLLTSQTGYPHIATPGIDKIANDGMYFSRNYCSYPVCTSSRKSFVTGEMPSKAGDVTTHVSIGTQFKNNDYETVYYGKWHVGSTHMDDAGVDVWHGFDTYIDARVDSDIYEWSSNFLKQAHEKPFFMVTSFLNPHDCCELARNIAGDNDSYHDGPVEENADIALCPPLPYNFAIPPNEAEGYYTRRDQDPEDNYWSSMPNKLWTEVEWRQYMYGYDRLVEKVDKHVENLYDDLVEAGLLDNTIIVYTSDHGDGHSSHAWTQKKSFYEESVNVPLVIAWKGKIHKGLIDKETLASGLDIYPTILELAGITSPSDLPGKDLSSVLLIGEEDSGIDRDYVVSEINQKAYKGNTPGTFVGRMVVNQDYKYVLFDKGVNREQLFDIKNDPGELSPVVDNPEYESVLTLCRDQLKDWVTNRNDDFDVAEIISEYEANALLDAVLINDESLGDFDPTAEEQVLHLNVDVEGVINIDAIPVNSAASYSIQQPADLQGDEAERTVTITVNSEDQSATTVYKIRFDERPNRIEIGFIDNGIDVPLDGWASNYCQISEKIYGPGNHGDYDGDGAFKFIRGQSDKTGYLSSSFYEDLDSISFWLYVYKPAEEDASLKIETITDSDVKEELTMIYTSELSEDAWTKYKLAIDTEEATQLLLTSSLPYDGDTRLWLDDLTLYFKNTEEVQSGFTELIKHRSLKVYPNPCASTLTIDAAEGGKLSIYDITGEVMFSKAEVSSSEVINVSSLDRGIYIIEIQGMNTYTQRFIKS